MNRAFRTPLLLTLMCLALAGVPALAQTLYDTGGPELPSLVGTKIGSGQVGETPIVDVSWFCGNPGGCNVEDMTFWAFVDNPNVAPAPVSVRWLLSGGVPFDFKAGISGQATNINQVGDCLPAENQGMVCEFHFDFGGSVVQPFGLDWLNLYQLDDGRIPGDVF